VLPLLETILPQSVDSLARLAEIAGQEESYWRNEVDRVWQPVHAGPSEVILEADQLTGLAPALGRRVVRRALDEAIGRCEGVTHEQVERIMRLAQSTEGRGKVTVPGGEVWRSFGLMRIAGGLTRTTAGAGVKVFVQESAYNEGSHRIDADKAPMPWSYRRWQPGDCYQPVGANRPMRLKELFHRARVPSWERGDWPMVLSEGRIVWSRRFGVAQWALAGPNSCHIIDVRE